MKAIKLGSIVFAGGIVAALVMAAAPLAHAQTIWNGPGITFSHTPQNGLEDQLTPGVEIARAGNGGLYNAVTESGATVGVSPKDTEWALGSLSNYSSLNYGPCPLESGESPQNDVGDTYVVHLVSEDIYLSLTLTGWGVGSGNTSFSYTRTTPLAVSPPAAPTVSITSPTDGATFAAPANVNILADAMVTNGTVDSVEIFTNGISAGTVLNAPFSLTASNLTPGAYALTAVATASGISATSAVVNITVVPPPTVSVTIASPPGGAVFVAPANVNIDADVLVTNGIVDSVEFFTNGISLGTVLTAPFNLTASNLALGGYVLTAVVTASGISATSLVVNVSVVNPAPVNLSGASVSNGQFTFNYTADAGLSYVIESSSNLTDWVSLSTNVASGSPVTVSEPFDSTGIIFYRVGLAPNP
jgi:hypothetical protein